MSYFIKLNFVPSPRNNLIKTINHRLKAEYDNKLVDNPDIVVERLQGMINLVNLANRRCTPATMHYYPEKPESDRQTIHVADTSLTLYKVVGTIEPLKKADHPKSQAQQQPAALGEQLTVF